MADQPQNYPGYTVTESTDPVTGVKTINREIAPDGHPILTIEMFLNLAKANLAAAKSLNQKSEKNNIEKQAAKQGLEEVGTKLDVFFSSKEGKEAEIAFQHAKNIYDREKRIKERGGERDLQAAEQEFNKAFDAFYDMNMKKLKKVNRLLVHYVDPKDKDKDIKKVMKKIKTETDNIRATEARPTQHNQYEALGLKVTSSHTPEGDLNTLQKSLYQEVHGVDALANKLYTGPSTIRDERQVGQCNAIRTDIVVGDKIVFSGHRHGSASPLKINDEAGRQRRTMQNVRQTLAIAAKEKMDKMSGEDKAEIIAGTKTLELDMASMSLLSPLIDDNPFVHPKADDPMKQFRQVNDCRLAYWSFQGREIELDVLGTAPIKVKLNSTFMNVGVNAGRGVGTLEAQALVQRVNNRGLNNLMDNFVKSLSSDNKNSKSSGNTACQFNINQIEKENEKIVKYKGKIKSYDRASLHKAYKDLEEANDGLHLFQEQLKNVSDNKEKTKAIKERIKEKKSNRTKAIKIIKKEEKKLDNYYKNLAIVRKKAYQEKLPELKKILTEYQVNSPEKLKEDKSFQKMRLFVDTLDTFYNQPQPGYKRLIKQKVLSREKKKLIENLNNAVDPAKKKALSDEVEKVQLKIDALNQGNYQFQARFALLSQSMDNSVEWFCKSGEDRTGLLNEHIEAYCIFIEKMGYPPRWNNEEDDKLFHEIMPHVHNGAPNRETNAYNDGSPGLKVSDADFVMRTVSYCLDKKCANMSSDSGKKFGNLKVEEIKQSMEIEIEAAPTLAITTAYDLKSKLARFFSNKERESSGLNGKLKNPKNQ